jgi:WD40 repeat protein
VHVWSVPGGTKRRTIDFGATSSWQVGPGRLFSETEVPGRPGLLDLRSWVLPDGEVEALGRVDTAVLNATSSAFEPHGRSWLYTSGATTRMIPLPVGRGEGRVFSRHPRNVRVYAPVGRSDVLVQQDDSGENRILVFPEGASPVTRILPRPESAPVDVVADSSARWLQGDLQEDAKLRLWDTTALPGEQPLELRRDGSWYAAAAALDPAARVAVASTHRLTRLTFWPLPATQPHVVGGYKEWKRTLAFSLDNRWLASSWGDRRLRLWPLPGSGSTEIRILAAPSLWWLGLAFDPRGRYLFAVGEQAEAWIVPLDGSPGRRLSGGSPETLFYGAAVSPGGRRVATGFGYGKGTRTLRVFDVDTGAARVFDLPVPAPPLDVSPTAVTGYEGGIFSVAFVDDSTLYTAGHGGVRRWNLDTGAHALIRPCASDQTAGFGLLTSDRRQILSCCAALRDFSSSISCALTDATGGGSSHLQGFADVIPRVGATRGPIVALAGTEGAIRIGLLSGGPPHLLLGHAGQVDELAISPDLKWLASTGEDNTLRLWPMPDLSKPPLHALPHGQLVTKLKSLTNLRAVRDPKSSTGWAIELGPFPGWKDTSSW